MIVYKIENIEQWTKEKDHIAIVPIESKKGYFLTMGMEYLWPELDWQVLEKIELLETDFIVSEL